MFSAKRVRAFFVETEARLPVSESPVSEPFAIKYRNRLAFRADHAYARNDDRWHVISVNFTDHPRLHRKMHSADCRNRIIRNYSPARIMLPKTILLFREEAEERS